MGVDADGQLERVGGREGLGDVPPRELGRRASVPEEQVAGVVVLGDRAPVVPPAAQALGGEHGGDARLGERDGQGAGVELHLVVVGVHAQRHEHPPHRPVGGESGRLLVRCAGERVARGGLIHEVERPGVEHHRDRDRRRQLVDPEVGGLGVDQVEARGLAVGALEVQLEALDHPPVDDARLGVERDLVAREGRQLRLETTRPQGQGDRGGDEPVHGCLLRLGWRGCTSARVRGDVKAVGARGPERLRAPC